ncbi:MAG TPA: phage portal protein [Actinomycetota bacterium]|nr:phage portal protein [Actinomycetota bacterium]
MLGKLIRSARSLPLSWDEYANLFKFGNTFYPLTTYGAERDQAPETFAGFAGAIHAANPAVWRCVSVRQMIFSEARFRWREVRDGIPGDLSSSPALSLLERPEPNRTTSDLLSTALTYADLGGSWFGYRSASRIRSLRPDWTEVIFATEADEAASPWDLDVDVVAYRYWPGGKTSGKDPWTIPAYRVAQFSPNPDPLAPWRGMSWLTPLLREVMGDSAATRHKLKFFEQGATPNMLVKPPPDMGKEEFLEWKTLFDEEYDRGTESAFRRMFIGGGADAEVVGSNFQEMDFRALQGLAETRIASASGVGAVIAQFSEGLQGSSLNTGNYQAARRLVADSTMRPLWSKMVSALSNIFQVPAGKELWYDERHIPFLQEDAEDDAKILGLNAVAIRQLTDAGFNPTDVVDAITSGDLRRLRGSHSGLFSVQLQKPGEPKEVPNEEPPALPPAKTPRELLPSLEEEFEAFLREGA